MSLSTDDPRYLTERVSAQSARCADAPHSRPGFRAGGVELALRGCVVGGGWVLSHVRGLLRGSDISARAYAPEAELLFSCCRLCGLIVGLTGIRRVVGVFGAHAGADGRESGIFPVDIDVSE